MNSMPCSLCPSCKHYQHVSGSSNPHRCNRGSNLVRENAVSTGDCNQYSPKN